MRWISDGNIGKGGSRILEHCKSFEQVKFDRFGVTWYLFKKGELCTYFMSFTSLYPPHRQYSIKFSESISRRHSLSIRESHRSLYPVTGNQTIKTQFGKQNTFTITAKYEKWLVHDPVQHENHLFFEQDPIQLGEDEKFFFYFYLLSGVPLPGNSIQLD